MTPMTCPRKLRWSLGFAWLAVALQASLDRTRSRRQCCIRVVKEATTEYLVLILVRPLTAGRQFGCLPVVPARSQPEAAVSRSSSSSTVIFEIG
uniref:Putative secreted protein n=1 Tax=Ixodes ricinus TaxID=34613 RepID=A0A6B0UCX2_IXORI